MTTAAFERLEDAEARIGSRVSLDLWPEPDRTIANGGRRPPPPFPLEIFGAWRPWIEASAEGKGAPPDYIAAGLLAAVASLIGNSRWASPWPSWQEPTALWIGLVGAPSSGKSPGLDAALDLLRTVERELADGEDFEAEQRRFERTKETAKALLDAWKVEVQEAVKKGLPAPEKPVEAKEPDAPVPPRLILSDATVEAVAKLLAAYTKGLLVYRDELSGWVSGLNKYSDGDRSFWIQAFGGRSYIVDRVKHGREPIRIPHLTLSVAGTVQPDKLHSLLASGDDDGLPARFLLLWPERQPPRRPTVMPDDGPALEAFRRLQSLSLDTDDLGKPRPRYLALTEDAIAAFCEWREERAAEEADASGFYLSFLGKLPGVALRLACVFEHLEWCADHDRAEPDCIGVRSLGFALHFVDEYLRPMALRSYGDAALPAADRDAMALARWLRKTRASTLNLRDLRRSSARPAGLRSPEQIKAAAERLCEADWLRPAPSRAGDTPGRAKADYAVNPRLRECEE